MVHAGRVVVMQLESWTILVMILASAPDVRRTYKEISVTRAKVEQSIFKRIINMDVAEVNNVFVCLFACSGRSQDFPFLVCVCVRWGWGWGVQSIVTSTRPSTPSPFPKTKIFITHPSCFFHHDQTKHSVEVSRFKFE